MKRLGLILCGIALAVCASSVLAANQSGKINTGAWAYQQENHTGSLVLSPIFDTPGKYSLNISTSNNAGNLCEFEGECVVKNGKLICGNGDIEDNKDNFLVVEQAANNSLNVTKAYSGICGMGAYATGLYKPKCLEKILESKTATGQYLGWFEPEEGLNFLSLKTKDGQELEIVASEEEAKQVVGNKKGQTVTVSYNVEQVWMFDECKTINTIKAPK